MNFHTVHQPGHDPADAGILGDYHQSHTVTMVDHAVTVCLQGPRFDVTIQYRVTDDAGADITDLVYLHADAQLCFKLSDLPGKEAVITLAVPENNDREALEEVQRTGIWFSIYGDN